MDLIRRHWEKLNKKIYSQTSKRQLSSTRHSGGFLGAILRTHMGPLMEKRVHVALSLGNSSH